MIAGIALQTIAAIEPTAGKVVRPFADPIAHPLEKELIARAPGYTTRLREWLAIGEGIGGRLAAALMANRARLTWGISALVVTVSFSAGSQC